MERREFLHLLGLGLAAGWVGGRISWPRTSLAGEESETGWRLALLADAHLMDGDERRPEAQALARAVSEIRALKPAPDLMLFAGDLAHRADPRALALGKEILSDLPGPLFMVMGEGDGLPEAATPWRRLFGDPWFCQTLPKPEDRETANRPPGPGAARRLVPRPRGARLLRGRGRPPPSGPGTGLPGPRPTAAGPLPRPPDPTLPPLAAVDRGRGPHHAMAFPVFLRCSCVHGHIHRQRQPAPGRCSLRVREDWTWRNGTEKPKTKNQLST